MQFARQRVRFSVLDGWRGIAACGVAAFHFGVINHLYEFPLFRNASPYVDFFFVLSGFVIAHTYSSRISSVEDTVSFMVRRFGRLWPLHVFTLACLVVLEAAKLAVLAATGLSAGEAPFTGSSAASAIPAHLAFLQAVGIFHTYTWNGPSWSIGCEFWTYGLFALACVFGGRRRTALSVVFIVIGAVGLVIANEGVLGATYDFGMFRCVVGFFTGSLTYQVFLLVDWPRRTFATLAEVIAAASIALVVGASGELRQIHHLFSFLPVIAFPIAILVFGRERGLLSVWLVKSPLQSLGRWSYSIYMVHFVVLTVLNSGLRVFDKIQGTNFSMEKVAEGEPHFIMNLWAGDLVFVVYLTAVIGMAAITWKYVEEPFRIYFNDIAKKTDTRKVLTSGSSTNVG